MLIDAAYDEKMSLENSVPAQDPFRLLADNAMDLIYICRLTPVFSCEYISPSCFDITGYRPQEFYDDPQLGFRMVHPDDLALVQNNINTCHETHSCAVRWFHKDGRIIHLEVRQTPGRDAEGNIHSIYGIARDVTAVKAAAEEIDRIGQRFRAMFHGSPIGALLYDENGVLLDGNRALQEMFGVKDMGHLQGHNLFGEPAIGQVHKDEIRKGRAARYEQEFDFGEAQKLGIYPFHRKGKIHLGVIISPIQMGGNGKIACYLVQVEDITGRKNMDAALANLRRAKEYFTTVAAHELRTPLVSMQLAMALLDEAKDERTDRPLVAKASAAIGRAFANLEKIASSTQALNDLFLMKSALETKPIHIKPVLERAAETVRAGVLRAGRKVEVVMEADGAFCQSQTMADTDLLAKAFTEGVSNAVKFSHDGETVRLTCAVEEGHAVLRITDEGEGLTAAELEALGEPYFSTRDPFRHFTGGYSKGGGGIGLGLVVIRAIITAFGGSVILQSPGKGKGSTLVIRLPVA